MTAEEIREREIEELRARIVDQDEVICMLVRELARLARTIHFLKLTAKEKAPG